jgi:glycosyltransferase involved in cell wall biosynthesis
MSNSIQDDRRCVIIPSYNSGSLLAATVDAALECWNPVIVVLDGSTDGSGETLRSLSGDRHGLHVLIRDKNGGKGEAVLMGLEYALERGYTHAALLDADGQHEASDLRLFMEASDLHPEAMILGLPIFGEDAPPERVKGRRIGNWWANLETLWGGIGDSLFGFRVYPIAHSLKILRGIRGGRRFDFDTQLAVRLYWEGVPPVNIPTRVRYPRSESGGVTHFHYLRDNLLLIRVHLMLVIRSLLLFPRLLRLRRRPALLFP